MSSSGDDVLTCQTLYKNNPDYSDVIPIPQRQTDPPIVSICYTERFKDCYDYLRAFLLKNEFSERAFKLTTDAVILNPANYTVWCYRRNLLKKLNKDLRAELEFVNGVVERNPKSYQIWFHRQVIITELDSPEKEFQIIDKIFSNDSKNYHAWQYRQWLIKHFNLFDTELEYTTRMLKDDIRNNSVWNMRYFVITHTTGYSDPDTLATEVKFTLDAIMEDAYNESPWNYLRGILMNDTIANYIIKSGDEAISMVNFVENMHNSGAWSNHSLGFLLDCYEEILENSSSNKTEVLDKVQTTINKLKQIDPIRVKYWTYVSERLHGQFSQNSQ